MRVEGLGGFTQPVREEVGIPVQGHQDGCRALAGTGVGGAQWAHTEIGVVGERSTKPKLASQICSKTVLLEDCVLLHTQGPVPQNSRLSELSLL